MDETRLDERRETCLSATCAEFAIVRNSTIVLRMGVGMNRHRCLHIQEGEQTPSALRQLASVAKTCE